MQLYLLEPYFTTSIPHHNLQPILYETSIRVDVEICQNGLDQVEYQSIQRIKSKLEFIRLVNINRFEFVFGIKIDFDKNFLFPHFI